MKKQLFMFGGLVLVFGMIAAFFWSYNSPKRMLFNQRTTFAERVEKASQHCLISGAKADFCLERKKAVEELDRKFKELERGGKKS